MYNYFVIILLFCILYKTYMLHFYKYMLFFPKQINNQILYGRSHQNASAIIKTAPSNVKLVFIR